MTFSIEEPFSENNLVKDKRKKVTSPSKKRIRILSPTVLREREKKFILVSA